VVKYCIVGALTARTAAGFRKRAAMKPGTDCMMMNHGATSNTLVARQALLSRL
jgi:hypothetical protein